MDEERGTQFLISELADARTEIERLQKRVSILELKTKSSAVGDPSELINSVILAIVAFQLISLACDLVAKWKHSESSSSLES